MKSQKENQISPDYPFKKIIRNAKMQLSQKNG
jgi:hypothetical protein